MRAPLADYGIVYFATHGLVAGDVKGLAELSLVLSIPRQPTEFDDGLLTASEVAQLKLNAEWVVGRAEAVCADRRGGCALKFSIVQCSIFHRIEAATDGRATTTPNQGKAPQHPVDPNQPPSPE